LLAVTRSIEAQGAMKPIKIIEHRPRVSYGLCSHWCVEFQKQSNTGGLQELFSDVERQTSDLILTIVTTFKEVISELWLQQTTASEVFYPANASVL
jgi:hypothetical protein